MTDGIQCSCRKWKHHNYQADNAKCYVRQWWFYDWKSSVQEEFHCESINHYKLYLFMPVVRSSF